MKKMINRGKRSKASRKHKQESPEFSRDKSLAKGSPSHINCKTRHMSNRIFSD